MRHVLCVVHTSGGISQTDREDFLQCLADFRELRRLPWDEDVSPCRFSVVFASTQSFKSGPISVFPLEAEADIVEMAFHQYGYGGTHVAETLIKTLEDCRRRGEGFDSILLMSSFYFPIPAFRFSDGTPYPPVSALLTRDGHSIDPVEHPLFAAPFRHLESMLTFNDRVEEARAEDLRRNLQVRLPEAGVPSRPFRI
jgi:hypothetical protein